MKNYPHLARRSLSTALLLTVTGAGCASDPAEAPWIDPSDTTAPLVVSTTPTTSATGVSEDETIVVTFDEQMDPATVEDAYSSGQLPLDKVSFQWNTAGTVLTIRPDAPLAYARGTGTDLTAVPALTYAITIGTQAADLAGNQLASPLVLSFATRRRLVASFPLDALTRALIGSSSLGISNDMWIGDNAVDNTFRSYVSFDLSSLPAGSEIEAATFSARQLPSQGAPYTIGDVMAQHVNYAIASGLNSLVPMSVPGAFSTNANIETKSIEVTPEVHDDVVNRATRGDRSQFRLAIDVATDSDGVVDKAIFAKDTFSMTATYVVD